MCNLLILGTIFETFSTRFNSSYGNRVGSPPEKETIFISAFLQNCNNFSKLELFKSTNPPESGVKVIPF